jgi:hypothetical protein
LRGTTGFPRRGSGHDQGRTRRPRAGGVNQDLPRLQPPERSQDADDDPAAHAEQPSSRCRKRLSGLPELDRSSHAGDPRRRLGPTLSAAHHEATHHGAVAGSAGVRLTQNLETEASAWSRPMVLPSLPEPISHKPQAHPSSKYLHHSPQPPTLPTPNARNPTIAPLPATPKGLPAA